jgi:V8-like Glu-specific endopeptidase
MITGCVITYITATLAITATHCTTTPLLSWGDVAIIEVDEREYEPVQISCEQLRGKYTMKTPEEDRPVTILTPIRFKAEGYNIEGNGYLIREFIRPGLSGSPVYNDKGELVAIAHGYYGINGVITPVCLWKK